MQSAPTYNHHKNFRTKSRFVNQPIYQDHSELVHKIMKKVKWKVEMVRERDAFSCL